MSRIFDAIVIGAGIEGSATAYDLAKNNNDTLLIEQFPLPHGRGSSHGQSRIIRKAYIQKHYAQMMITAYKDWEQLEKDTQTELFIKGTGLVYMATGSGANIDNIAQALENINAVYDRLSAQAMAKRFPMLRADNSYKILFDPEAGILRADKALQAYQDEFVRLGGTLHDSEQVKQIIPGDPVTISTTKQQYQTRSLVVCAGPWTTKLVASIGLHLPLKPIRVGVYYWKSKTGQHSSDVMPCVVYDDSDKKHHAYGLPTLEYPDHIKLCFHDGPAIDPDYRDSDKSVKEAKKIEHILKDLIKNHFPGVEQEASIQETCIYTMTPDEDFILDSHPHWKNIVVGAGFSGHGFKLAPVVGKILSALATGRQPIYDLEPFKINRFFKEPSAAKL